MTYIHERPDWPRFHWDLTALAPSLTALRYRQGKLLGRMSALGLGVQEEASLGAMTDEAVTTSAIEGERLDPGSVRSSLARRLGIDAAGLPPTSRAVDGLVDMLLDATRNHAVPLSAERLFGWHAALFPTGWSGLRRISVGCWRPAEVGPMQVVSGPPDREKVHFEAPEADRLPAEMSAFLDWFDGTDGIDPVLKAGLAHFRFVTIHPFEDGNGRIARAIADMSLARAEGSALRFYSMSSRIAVERADYYRQLELQQRSDLDVTGWLLWFVGCLDRAIAVAETNADAVIAKARFWVDLTDAAVNPRQRLVLNRLLDGFQGHLTTGKYAKLAKCSPDTALRDIADLVSRGVLVRNPEGGRSTSYRLGISYPS